ncbi:MAG: N-6 DNA methylase, partial [Armatimonadota bacterium]
GAELSDLRPEALAELAAHYDLTGREGQPELLRVPSLADIERVRRFPTEVLFLERFVEICRPDGWIAIILPEGLFANIRWRGVRRWLLGHLTVHLVVALPRATFRAHATTARTCMMLMQRRPPPATHRTALCHVDDCTPAGLERMRRAVTGEISPGDRAGEALDLVPPIFRA